MLRFLVGKMRRKGVIALQLNWIFVLIIGAIILTFFIVIVQKQREVSEQTISGAIQTDLQAIFASSAVSTGTASIVEVPSREISFSCEGFKVGNQFAANFPYAFAPDLIKSDRNTISIYAYDWSIPMRITNLLYVTSPDVRYILVGTGDTMTHLEEIMPPRYIEKDGQSKLFMDWMPYNSLSSVPPDNGANYKVKFVFVESLPGTSTVSGFEKADWSALLVNNDQTLKLYTKPSRNSVALTEFVESDYDSDAMLLAAIFAENNNTYECGRDNANDRLEFVKYVYKNRTQKLNDDLSSCNYDSALIDLDSLPSLDLENENNQLLENSCPAVY
jgi:hypothetical protein